MKALITTLALLGSISAFSADVECTKDKRGFYRPSNQAAIDIAAALKVKTCDRSDRFLATVEEMGLTHNLPEKSKSISLNELKQKYAKGSVKN